MTKTKPAKKTEENKVYDFANKQQINEEIDGDGWKTFYKNTAVQSFSQEGVD